MRKFIIIFLATVVGLTIWAFIGLYYVFEIHCKGRLSECYRSFVQPTNRGPYFDPRWALKQFSASREAAAFWVVIGNRSAIVFVDLRDGRARLIYDEQADYWHPHLSEDGNRIVLVRAPRGDSTEILSCEIATWRCEVVLRAKEAIRSPIEVDANTIVYASSPPFAGYNGQIRYRAFDLSLVRKGQAAKRLSFLEYQSIERLSLSKHGIAFSVQQLPGPVKTVEDYSPPRRSHVFVLYFDRETERLRLPDLPLVPVLAPTAQWGLSEFATLAPDGLTAIVVTGRKELTVMDFFGHTALRYDSAGDQVSPAVFLGKDVVFGELYADRYVVRRLDLFQDTSEALAAFNHSQQALRNFEKITLTIAN